MLRAVAAAMAYAASLSAVVPGCAEGNRREASDAGVDLTARWRSTRAVLNAHFSTSARAATSGHLGTGGGGAVAIEHRTSLVPQAKTRGGLGFGREEGSIPYLHAGGRS